jgi:hypothetical protein
MHFQGVNENRALILLFKGWGWVRSVISKSRFLAKKGQKSAKNGHFRQFLAIF